MTVHHYENGAWVAYTSSPVAFVGGVWVAVTPKYWDGTQWVVLA